MRYLIVTTLALSLPSSALAWGFDGHRITGQITDNLLTPAAAAGVADLLGGQSLAEATLWADLIKGDRPETRPWHYLNPPLGLDAITLDLAPPEGSVLDKSVDFIGILQDPATSPADRLEALRFTLHLVGDLHNPLHMGLEDDRGGNDRAVIFNGSFTNLHALWDWGLIASTNIGWQDYAQQLTDDITSQQSADWTGGSVEDWATESYIQVHTVGYPDTDPSSTYFVTQEYADTALAVINERLAQSGVRLANILNQAFADALDGDFNADGFVSQADLDLVLLNWGAATLPLGWSHADQFDGVQISQNELDLVLLNWGNGAAPDSAAVPEPATTTLAAIGLGAWGRRRRANP